VSGTTVKIELSDKAERRRKSAAWMNRAILNLAKAAKQNGCSDKKTLVRMAERARLLAVHVPETDWAECDWSDDLLDEPEE
jgi:hypothetical protein